VAEDDGTTQKSASIIDSCCLPTRVFYSNIQFINGCRRRNDNSVLQTAKEAVYSV